MIDALAPFGVRHLQIPLNGETVWRAIDGAAKAGYRRACGRAARGRAALAGAPGGVNGVATTG